MVPIGTPSLDPMNDDEFFDDEHSGIFTASPTHIFQEGIPQALR
jgi:hypothetical protein